MPDPEPPTIAETLRTLIMAEQRENRRTLKQLAIDAEVPYQVIQKWSRGEVVKLDVGIAERVYQTLTGKTFNHGN
jgi:phospholipase C